MECGICLMKIRSTKKQNFNKITTSCNHTFHLTCLAEWITLTVPPTQCSILKDNPTCPMCRTPLIKELLMLVRSYIHDFNNKTIMVKRVLRKLMKEEKMTTLLEYKTKVLCTAQSLPIHRRKRIKPFKKLEGDHELTRLMVFLIAHRNTRFDTINIKKFKGVYTELVKSFVSLDYAIRKMLGDMVDAGTYGNNTFRFKKRRHKEELKKPLVNVINKPFFTFLNWHVDDIHDGEIIPNYPMHKRIEKIHRRFNKLLI